MSKSCNCGRELNDHDQDIIDSFKDNASTEQEQWNPNTCTSESGLTNAYGELKFTGFGENNSKVNSVNERNSIHSPPTNFLIVLQFPK
jgi:hypothetical protein